MSTACWLLPTAYCFLPTVLYELLRLVEPALIWRGTYKPALS